MGKIIVADPATKRPSDEKETDQQPLVSPRSKNIMRHISKKAKNAHQAVNLPKQNGTGGLYSPQMKPQDYG